MATSIPLNKKTVNIENIVIAVTCPACERQINTKLRSPSFMKNCRCNNTTFVVTVKSGFGSKIKVKVMAQVGFQVSCEIPVDSWEVGDEA